MSLSCVHLKLFSEESGSQPISAHIDGYYDLVIPIGGNIIRIPLISEDNKTPISLPPSIRFLGDEHQKKNFQEFIINKAPKNGRLYQLHSFISFLNRSDPRQGLRVAFCDSLTSIDLSFSTSICSLVYKDLDKPIIQSLINILGCYNIFDHFLRVLSSLSRLVVISQIPEENIQFVSLLNIFLSNSIEWIDEIKFKNKISLNDLLHFICYEKLNDFSDLSLYCLKSALVITSYHDPSGDATIAMFLELTIRPFIRKLYLENEYYQLKESLIKGDPEFEEIRQLIQDSILNILGADIIMKFSPSKIIEDLDNVYNFVLKNIDRFVKSVIYLNSLPKEKNPLIQTILFVYQICQDRDIEEN